MSRSYEIQGKVAEKQCFISGSGLCRIGFGVFAPDLGFDLFDKKICVYFRFFLKMVHFFNCINISLGDNLENDSLSVVSLCKICLIIILLTGLIKG